MRRGECKTDINFAELVKQTPPVDALFCQWMEEAVLTLFQEGTSRLSSLL